MWRTLAVCALCIGVALPLQAQAGSSRLTLSGFSGLFGAVTITAFDDEYLVAPAPVTWTLERVNGAGNPQRTMTLRMVAQSGTFSGGTGNKPISDLEWQRADTPNSWQSMTTTPVVITSIVRGNPSSTSGDIEFRIRMPWATTPPGNYTATVVWTMTVTPP
jgi:hypothetical protein